MREVGSWGEALVACSHLNFRAFLGSKRRRRRTGAPTQKAGGWLSTCVVGTLWLSFVLGKLCGIAGSWSFIAVSSCTHALER